MPVFRTVLNVASLGLVAVIGVLLLRSAYGVLRPDSLYAPEIIVEPGPLTAAATSARQYDFSSDPFNLDVADAPVVAIDPGLDAPETTLDLELRGTTTGEGGGALLLLPGGTQVRVAIDDEVMDNVTLTGVSASFVTLNVGGQTQRLSLDRGLGNAEGGTTGLIQRKADIAPVEILPTTVSVPASAAIPDAPRPTAVTGVGDVSDFLAKVRIDPVRKDGKPIGFSVEPRSGTDLSAYGLRRGDLITRLGPVDLTARRPDFLAIQKALQNARAAGGLDVSLLRDGQPLQLRLGQ